MSSVLETPSATITPAPASAVTVFGTRSVAISMYATTKTTTAMIGGHDGPGRAGSRQ